MVKNKSHSGGVKENLDITDELIAERRTSFKMPKDMTPWMAKTIELIDLNMLRAVSYTHLTLPTICSV